MRKQPEITEKTRRAFMEAFCLIYIKKPIDKISVQEVARKAGYNRSTFYQYFFDLNDLLEYVERDLVEYIQSTRGRQNAGKGDVLCSLVDVYKEKSVYVDALFGEFGSNRFMAQVKEALSQDKSWMEGMTDDVRAPYLMEYRVSVALSLFGLWLRRGKDLPLPEFFEMVDELYRLGVGGAFPPTREAAWRAMDECGIHGGHPEL